jgi:hypothetical protein
MTTDPHTERFLSLGSPLGTPDLVASINVLYDFFLLLTTKNHLKGSSLKPEGSDVCSEELADE